MPKSASTLLHELTKKAVETCFGASGQNALEAALDASEIPGKVGYVENCSERDILEKLRILSEKHGPFVVKAHEPLTDDMRQAIIDGYVRVSYICRDPRDALLSAISNYEATKRTATPEFDKFDTFEHALKEYIYLSEQAVIWKKSKLSVMLYYENFVTTTESETILCLKGLGINYSEQQVAEIVAVAKEQQKSNHWNLRFNKGIIGRFRKELTPNQIIQASAALEVPLRKLGYKL